MKNLIFFGLLTLPLSSQAVTLAESVRHVCATGESQEGVQINPVPFQDVTEDDSYAGKYKATYSMFNKTRVGYAKKEEKASIIYGIRLYPVSSATLLNTDPIEYQRMLAHGDLDLGQAADWSLLTTNQKEQYLCISLNKSMEQAAPLTYVLSLSSQPRHLFFSAGK